jgi:hypothetical protein
MWDYDSLWQKTKMYMLRAFQCGRESADFALNCSLAMEFLARAALAKIHPALLADPQGSDNVLYAFGFSTTDKPKSIAITTVYIRCTKINPDFTDDMAKSCTSLSERRNAELHSGDPAFDGIPTSVWLAQFYKSCKVLLASQGRTLTDILPDHAEVVAAEQMIAGLDSQYTAEAKKAIGIAAHAFSQLSKDEQNEAQKRGSVMATLSGPGRKRETCPSCGGDAILRGIRIRATRPQLGDDSRLHWEEIYLPDKLICGACALSLDGHPILQGANIGGQFTVESSADPATYYSPEEEYFEEYNNM